MTGADDGSPIQNDKAAPDTVGAGNRSLFGGGLATLCFFLPWLQVSCMGQTARINGPQLAGESGVVWLVLGAGLLIIGAVLYFRSVDRIEAARPVILASAATALAILLYKFVQLQGGVDTEYGRVSSQMLQLSLQIGAYGTLVGFGLAIHGALGIKGPARAASDPVGAAAGHAGVDLQSRREVIASAAHFQELARKLAVHATSIARDRGTQVLRSAGHDGRATLVWARNHRSALISSTAIIGLAFAAFYLLSPKPQERGAVAGALFANCNAQLKAETETSYRSFASTLRAQPPRTRSQAEQGLSGVQESAKAAYANCLAEANARYEEERAKWVENPEKASVFEAAVAAARGSVEQWPTSVAFDQIASAAPSFSLIRELITGIRPAAPDEARVATDLVGREIDGWRFAYLSELKSTYLESSSVRGDSLDLRVRLVMEDFRTQAPYAAIVLMKYVVRADAWSLASMKELLLTSTPAEDYRVNGEFFLVGRWRWSTNYSTFHPDGTWTGEWDDGSTGRGDWRIINGELVMTNNGMRWVRAKITSYTQRELLVESASGGTLRAERTG